MNKTFTHRFNELLAIANKGRKPVATIALITLILTTAFYVWAAISVPTPVSLSVSSDNAVNGPTPGFTTLNNIVIRENSSDDFRRSTSGELILTAPSGWVFRNSGVTISIANIGTSGDPTQVNINSGGITYPTPNPAVTQGNSTTIRIPYSVSNENRLDQINISGIGVLPLNGNILTPANVQFTVSNTANVVGTFPVTVATLTQTPGSPYKLAFATQPGATNTSQVGESLVNQPQVRFLDYFNREVNTGNNPVSLSISSGTTGAVLTAAPTNAVNGLATFSGVAINLAGTNYKLTATSSLLGGATSIESAAFTVNNKRATITNLSPNCYEAGSILTITGENFVPGAIVRFTNSDNPNLSPVDVSNLTSLSSTQIVITVPVISPAGNYLVQVINPAPVQSGTPDTAPFTVYSLLNAGSITGEANVCTGATNVVYSAPLVAGANDYNWTVPQGATITSKETTPLDTRITVDFGTAASGNISVAAVNGCRTAGNPSSFSVTINPLPQTSITTPSAQSCSEVLLTADPVNGANYQWRFNGEPIPGAANQNTYSATQSGAYSVVLTNTNGATCPFESNRIAVIILAPTNIITNGPTASFCADSNVRLLALESDNPNVTYQYRWFNGTTLLPENSASLAVNTPGNYSVELTIPGTSCVIPSAATIVNELPAISGNTILAASAPSATSLTICANTPPFQIGSATEPTGGNGAGSYAYQWQSSPDGNIYTNIPGATQQNYTPASALTVPIYFQRIVNPNSSCASISNAFQITVNPEITNYAITTQPQTICTGSTLPIVAPQPNGGAGPGNNTYQWQSSTDGGNTYNNITEPTTELINYTYNPDTYTGNILFRRIISSGGCSVTSDPVAITVAPVPVADAGGPQAICSGGSTTIGTAAIAGLTYEWTAAEGSSTTNLSSTSVAQPTVTITNTGTAAITQTYSLVVTANGCSSAPSTVSITVNPLPPVSFNTPVTSLCVNSPAITLTGGLPEGGTYEGTGVNNGQFDPSVALDGIHTITYTYIDPNTQCRNTASQNIIVNPVPVATAGNNKTIICSGGSTTIGTAATGTNLSYEWTAAPGSDINNLSSTSVAQPTVTITNTGTAPVTQTYSLVVTANGCASAPSTVSVTVNPAPQVDFTTPGNRTAFFTGEGNITLTRVVTGVTNPTGPITVRNVGAQPTDIISGAIVNGNQFSPCVAGAGMKIIRYTYTNSNGCTAFIEKTVTVTQSTYTVVLQTVGFPVCRGQNTNYTARVLRDAVVTYPDPALIRSVAIKVESFQEDVTNLFDIQTGKNDIEQNYNKGANFSDASLSAEDFFMSRAKLKTGTNACAGIPTTFIFSNQIWLGEPENYGITIAASPAGAICFGTPVTFTASFIVPEKGPTPTYINPVYQWRVNGQTITGATGPTFTSSTLNNGDIISATINSADNGCGAIASTNTITMVVAISQTLAGGSYCAGSTGSIVMNGSQNGISYQLVRNGIDLINSPVAGTGKAITFSGLTFGSYSVRAIASGTTCLTYGPVTLNVTPLPTLHTVTGGGGYCANANPAGVPVGLDASQPGISYQLFRGTSRVGNPVAGNADGSAITFGPQTAGTYTVVATTIANQPTTAACPRSMTGSVTVSTYQLPNPQSISGGGNYCSNLSGPAISLGGSEVGVTYRLISPSNVVTPREGTGAAFSFGNFTERGTYTITATSASPASCPVTLGTVAVNPIAVPVAQTITGAGEYCAATTPDGVSIGLADSQPYTIYRLYREGSSAVLAALGRGENETGPFTFSGTYTAGTYIVNAETTASWNYGCRVDIASTTISTTPTVTNQISELGIIVPDEVIIGQPAEYKVNQDENSPSYNIDWTYNWRVSYADETSDTLNNQGRTLIIPSIREDMIAISVTQVAPTNICPDVKSFIFSFDPPVLLPVELIYLKATKQEKNVVKVEWATATEKDNKGFEVQVSQDAKTYRTLSFVPTQDGNTLQQQVYTFYDKENGKHGTRYYRLKQVDMNGESEFFGPKAVKMDDVNSTMVASPNPFLDEIKLEFSTEETGDMLVELTTATGAKVYERTLKVQKGFNSETLKMNTSLANGVYIITTHQGGKTNHIRLMKQQ